MNAMMRILGLVTMVVVGPFIGSWIDLVAAGTPSDPYYFEDQWMDHFDIKTNATWTQRYYKSNQYYNNSNNNTHNNPPIFVLLGGEGAIEPHTGLLYPFVSEQLAKAFGAYVLQPEHRFYGSSQPIPRAAIRQSQIDGLPDPRIPLLTYEQALYDAVRLLQHVAATELNCTVGSVRRRRHKDYKSHDNSTGKDDGDDDKDRNRLERSLDPGVELVPRCGPVIAVGGSYPGFLSAMTRIIVPDVFDISYAASAPMKFYAQQTLDTAYYDHITAVAENAVPGCAAAVQQTLNSVQQIYTQQPAILNETLIGICPGTVPEYATRNVTLFLQEIVMMVGYSFANANMAYYPPSHETALVRACSIFMDPTIPSFLARLSQFFRTTFVQRTNQSDCLGNVDSCPCFNMSTQLPSGRHTTISSGDWSGVGDGDSGDSWDFQTCTLLIERISFGPSSMFPQRPWTMAWLRNHCATRYNQVIPQPYALNRKWHINDLRSLNVSRILFTNGLNDGWSVSGIQTNLSDTLLALNFPNGAHHSDLRGIGPSDQDTEDIQYGHVQIQTIIHQWIQDVLKERTQDPEREQHNFEIMKLKT